MLHVAALSFKQKWMHGTLTKLLKRTRLS